MADDVANLVLVLLQELAGAGERNLVDVFVNLFFCHADTVIDNLEGLGFLVQLNAHIQLAQLFFVVAARGQRFHLLRGVHGIGHQFAEENLVVTVQELFDNRENVLGGYTNLSFVCHIVCVLRIKIPAPSWDRHQILKSCAKPLWLTNWQAIGQ